MDSSHKINSIVWFEIYVEDMKRAKKFYEGVFQTKLENLQNPGTLEQDLEMWSFPGDMTSYGANGAIVKMAGFPSGKNSVIIYFNSKDCKTEESRVVEFGGKVEKSKMSIGQHGFISICIDTEGNVFGLHSMN